MAARHLKFTGQLSGCKQKAKTNYIIKFTVNPHKKTPVPTNPKHIFAKLFKGCDQPLEFR
jgi:hypothetical protein